MCWRRLRQAAIDTSHVVQHQIVVGTQHGGGHGLQSGFVDHFPFGLGKPQAGMGLGIFGFDFQGLGKVSPG